MKTLAYILLSDFLSIALLWVFYLAVMNLQRIEDAAPMTGWTKRFARCVEVIGLLIDGYVNIVVLTRYVWEWPREWLVTGRLTRYVNAENGWRKNFAEWMCGTLLDRFDPSGCHCKKVELEEKDGS